jgi:hypothetical protein
MTMAATAAARVAAAAAAAAVVARNKLAPTKLMSNEGNGVATDDDDDDASAALFRTRLALHDELALVDVVPNGPNPKLRPRASAPNREASGVNFDISIRSGDTIRSGDRFSSANMPRSSMKMVSALPPTTTSDALVAIAVAPNSPRLLPRPSARGSMMLRASKSFRLGRSDPKAAKKGSGILVYRDRTIDDSFTRKTRTRKKVHFSITAAVKNRRTWEILALVVNPTVNAYVVSLHVIMLTYECWAIPFRLALMYRWHWMDMTMDAIALLSLTHALMVAMNLDYQRAHALHRRGITLFHDLSEDDEKETGRGDKVNVNNYLASVGATTAKQKKKMERKEKRKVKKLGDSMGDPVYAEHTVAQLKKSPYLLMIAVSLYVSEVVRIWAPERALLLFFLCAIVRCNRMVELGDFFRKKEMDLHANMRRVAFLKFFIMVFGLSHLTGCLSYFLARLGEFSGRNLTMTWVAQYKAYNPRYDYETLNPKP